MPKDTDKDKDKDVPQPVDDGTTPTDKPPKREGF